jgi:cytoskeletal protein RodZ
VPIGDALAGARQRAGLTVAQVSERTCIKEAVIEGIEGGDYSACGGDFYARANIRSIAKVVGADCGPLIAEYDALHRARDALSAVSLEELLATSAEVTSHRRPDRPTAGGPVASGSAAVRRRAGSRTARGPAGPVYRPRGRWVNWIVVLGVLGVLGFGVYSRFSGPRQTAAAPPVAGKHAVTHQPAKGRAPGPAPKLTHAAAAPAPAPTITQAGPASAPAAASAQTPTPVSTGAAAGAGGGSAPPPTARPEVTSRPVKPTSRGKAARFSRPPAGRDPSPGRNRPVTAMTAAISTGRSGCPRPTTPPGQASQPLPGKRHNARPEGHA